MLNLQYHIMTALANSPNEQYANDAYMFISTQRGEEFTIDNFAKALNLELAHGLSILYQLDLANILIPRWHMYSYDGKPDAIFDSIEAYLNSVPDAINRPMNLKFHEAD